MISFASVLKNKIVNQGYLGICVAERQLPSKSSLTTFSEIDSVMTDTLYKQHH